MYSRGRLSPKESNDNEKKIIERGLSFIKKFQSKCHFRSLDVYINYRARIIHIITTPPICTNLAGTLGPKSLFSLDSKMATVTSFTNLT
jgi:hypothetical protein